jgi:DNA-binding transcriptional LysR family regulator
VWRLVSATAEVEVTVRARVRAEDGEALHAPMLAGTGLGYPPELAVADALRRGDLVAVMPAWSRATLPLSLVCPSQRQRDPKVRQFVELAWAELHDRAPWSVA